MRGNLLNLLTCPLKKRRKSGGKLTSDGATGFNVGCAQLLFKIYYLIRGIYSVSYSHYNTLVFLLKPLSYLKYIKHRYIIHLQYMYYAIFSCSKVSAEGEITEKREMSARSAAANNPSEFERKRRAAKIRECAVI